MVKKQYRSEIGIVGDILDVAADAGRDGALVSEITRCANLSHYVTLAKCDKLVSAGLVRPDRNGRSRVFLITDKGRQFIHELENFRITAQGLNLRF